MSSSSFITIPSTTNWREWWAEQSRIDGTSWDALLPQHQHVFQQLCTSREPSSRWKQVTADACDVFSWKQAVGEYHREGAGRRLIVEIEPERLKRLRRLMQSAVTLEQAYWEINDPSNRPTPAVVVEAVMLAVRERGLERRKEPTTVERLQRCDAVARAEINQRIQELGLK